MTVTKAAVRARTAMCLVAKDSTAVLKSIEDQMKTLKGPDLKKLQVVLQNLLLTHPMELGPLPKSIENAEKFEVWDNGELEYDEWEFEGMYPHFMHKYTLKWNNGEEMYIVYGYQDGLIAAGTTKFETQAVQIGPLIVERSFPEMSRLPEIVSGADELHTILKKQGIVTYEQVYSFLNWTLSEVLSKHEMHMIEYVFQMEELFDGVEECEDEEEEA